MCSSDLDGDNLITNIIMASAFDFEGSGSVEQRVYGVSYAGDIDFTIGSPLSSITADSCLVLSDTTRYLTVLKDDCIEEPLVRSVSGRITNTLGEPLKNIRIEYGGKQFVTTDQQGLYTILDAPVSTSLELLPINNQNAGNGLSSLDLVLVTRHILGLDPFTDPLQLIAADANNSGSISASDLVAMQRVLLEQSTDFVGQSSWVFIPTNLNITSDILRDGVPFGITIPLGSDDLNDINFIGIKIGDLNGSATTE